MGTTSVNNATILFRHSIEEKTLSDVGQTFLKKALIQYQDDTKKVTKNMEISNRAVYSKLKKTPDQYIKLSIICKILGQKRTFKSTSGTLKKQPYIA